MKRMMKRGLSLLLAVLMVVSMLPTSVFAVTFADGEDSGGREETPVLDKNDPVVRPHSSGSRVRYEDLFTEPEASETPEEPDPSEGPGGEGEILWADVTLDAVLVDADLGEVRITGTLPTGNTSNAGLGNATVVLAPAWAALKSTIRAEKDESNINTGTTTAELITDIPDYLGVPSSLIYIVDVSSDTFKNGVWTHTATLGTGYTDYIAAAIKAGAGSDVSASAGIPMQVMLITRASGPDIAIEDVTIQPTQAILAVDPPKVPLQSSSTSFSFNLEHTDASNMDANIIGITWSGNYSEYVNPPTSITSLTLDEYDTVVTVTLGVSPAMLEDNYTGQIVIEYNDAINQQSRFLTVEVTTGSVTPIYVTVAQGDTTSGGTETTHASLPNGTEGFLDPESDPYVLGEDWLAIPEPPAQATEQFWSEGGLTLEVADGVYCNPDDYVDDAWVEFLPNGKPDYENEMKGWFDDIGPCPTTLTKVTATADVPVGVYSGSISLEALDSEWGYVDTITIPVFIKVVPASKYSAIFYVNGGTWAEEPLNVRTESTTDATKAGTAVTPPPDPTRANHTFLGWGTSNTATEATTSITYSSSATSPNTYYAIWKQNATTFTLTYDGNGGSDTVNNVPAKVTKQSTDDPCVFDLTFSPEPTREGYVFAGWSDSSGANNTADYTADGVTQAKVPQSSPDKTVYAVWTPVYKVEYKDATDTADHTYPKFSTDLPKDTNKYEAATAVTVKYVNGTAVNDELANDDGLVYKFTGWTRGDGGALVTTSTLNMPGNDVTLTATWSPVMVNVTYVLDGGTQGSPATTADSVPKTVQKGGTYTILAGNPTKNGYTFAGWTASGGGSGTGLKVNGTVSNVTADLTLTAVWTQDETTAVFHLNADDATWKDNTTGDITLTGTASDPASPAAAKLDPVRSHYVFGGWSNTAGDNNAAGKVNSTTFPAIGASANHYYAIWAKDKHTLTYAPGASSGVTSMPSPNPVTDIECGTEYDISATEPARTGYTFLGWKSDVDGDDTVYKTGTDDDAITVDDDITLIAQWEIKEYTVTYDWGSIGGGTPIKLAGGAETLPTQADVQHGGKFNVATTPSTATVYLDEDDLGWTLTGWTASGGGQSGNKAPGAEVSNVTGNVTLTAQWTAKNYTITFDKNTGSFTDGTTTDTKKVTVQHGAAAGAAPGVSKTDYTLIDWNTKSAASATDGTVFDPAALVTADATYYARWLGDTNDIVVKVTLDTNAYKDQTVSLKGQSGYTATESPDGTYTFSGIPVGTYTVVVNTREVATVTISKTTAGDVTAKFWTVTANVATDGTGTVATGASSVSGGTAATTDDKVIVYNGETAYVGATAATDYKFSTWSDNVSGTATTAANSVANVTDTTTVTATFVKKTGSIVVNAKLDAAGTAYTFPNGTVVTLVPTGTAKGADASKEKTQTVSGTSTGSVTFANLEHDSTNGWDIYVGDTKIADGSNVKVTGNDGSSVSKNAMYYTVEVKTGGNGDASLTANGSTLSTDYANSTPVTSNSTVVLEQTQVTWTVGTAATDYDFLNWDGGETNKTAYQNVSITKKTSHTANFSKVSFTVQAVVNLDEVAQTELGSSITAIKAVKTAGDKADPANLAFTYSATAGKWVLSGLPTGNTYKVVVTTSTGDFDIATAITADKSDVVGNFFTVKTATKSDCEDSQAKMAVTAPSATGKTEVVVKSGTAISLTVDAATGYTHTGWTEANTTNKVSSNSFTPTDVTTAGTGITLTPTFTYTATIKPIRGGDVYDVDTVVVKTGSTTVGTATEQTDKTWKVSGLTIGTNYDIWVNGYLSDKDTDGINTVEVPIWQLTTADSPQNSASTKTVKTKTSIDMPNGAGEADMALAAAAASGYRLRTATETPATWTSSDTIAVVAGTMDKVTVTNITKDVTLTVNTVKQWKVDVKNTTKTSGTLGAPTVSAGTAASTIDNNGNYLGSLVDAGGNISVSVTPVAGHTPVWTVTKSDGTTPIEGKTITGNSGTVTEVDQDMVITVDWVDTKYDVEVKVNLNNAAKTGLPDTQLYLVKGSDTVPLTETATGGTYTANVVPGTYAIWSPVASANGATAETTGRTISFSVADGEGTGDASKLKAELNYYTVKIAKEFSDDPSTAPNNVFAGHGSTVPANATAETAANSKIYLAGKGTATVNVPVSATNESTGEPNYKWTKWSADVGGTVPTAAAGTGNNYLLPGENTLKTADLGADGAVTVTAEFQRRYKVTLGKPVGKGIADGNYVTASMGGVSGKNSGTANNYVTVDVDTSGAAEVALDELKMNGPNASEYIFSHWTQNQTGDDAGTFTDGGTTKTGKDTFTPKTNTTITPNYWLKPTLTANVDKYHLNFLTEENVDKAPWNNTKNSLPKYTWTANDATYEKATITVDGTEKDLTSAEADIVTDGTTGNVTITFKRDYLLTLAGDKNGTEYTIKVYSHTPDTTAANAQETNKTATMKLYVTPENLIKVVIGVKDGTPANYETDPETAAVTGSATAKVNDATRGGVKYLDHAHKKIVPSNQLTYDWYYGPNPSTAQGGSATSTLTKSDAEALRPNGYTLITAGDTTGAVPVDNAAYKGKWIYAVVEASVTGVGAAVTNPIAVDYDAVIKVTKDGSANITGGNYTVWLVPQPSTGSNPAGYALADLPTSKVEAKYQSGNDYKTDDSTLTGGKTYDVYVNKVEGNTTYFVKTGKTVSTQTDAAANNIPTVEFFSVNAVNTIVKDAEDSTPTKVGETFQDSDKPATVFTTAGATDPITVTSGNGVFKGSAITAKTSKGDFKQDYHVDWGVTNTEPTASAPLGYNAEADKQTKAKAASDGISVTSSIAKKTWAGAQLDQNVYEIKGDIKGTGKVASATLTYKNGETTYTFNGNVGNGGNGDTVTFKVPKSGVDAGAITGEYTISAKGSTDPKTSVLGYSVPSKDDFDQKLPMELEPVSADGTGKFTIFIESSTWSLKVVDDNKKDALTAGDDAIASVERTHNSAVTAANNVSTGSASTTWTKTFANYDSGTTDQVTYTVTVSNPGNTDLKVSLVLKRGTDVIYDASTALTGNKDATNDVTFANLAASFDLAAKTGSTVASKSFTVTIPADLDNDDDVTYSFEFTSKDANDTTIYGPSLTYNLALVVNPIPVKSVSIKDNNDGTYSADALTFDATKTPLDQGTTPTLSSTSDLTYQWYVGTKPTVDATTGAVTGTAATGTGNNTATYTPVTADGGKTLWLVVKGQNNASQYAMASVAAPYSAKVTIMENTAETTDYTSYKVYLVPSDVTTQPTDWTAAGIVEATHKDDDGDGVFTSDAVLVNGKTYNVWTNVVKGTTNAVYKNSGALGTVTDGVASKTVTYYSVTMNKTTYDNQYAGLKGTDFFGTGTDGTTAASQTGDTGLTATAKAGTTDVASGGWVVAGTVVDFTHAAWTKDYTLAWTGATKQGTDAAGGGSAAKATVNANTTVDAKLTLTLYKVTAYATGKGEAVYITMASTGDENANTFTTKTDTPDNTTIVGVTGGSKNSVNAGSNVVFQIPKGSYTVLAYVDPEGGTTRLGYRMTHGAANLEEVPTITKAVSADGNYDVVLSSAGIGLKVIDDDATDPHQVSDVWQSGDAKDPKDTTHTQNLDYGYTDPIEIELTLQNNSSTISDEDTRLQTVYEITGEGADPNSSGVTWASTALEEDGTKTIAKIEDGDAEPTVTLTIPTGLEAGTYTYTATFTFSNEENGGAKGTLNYILKIVVKPAEFATVNMKYNGDSAALDTTKLLEAGKPLALNTATTTANDVFGSLTFTDDAKDYHYAWYASTDNSITTADLNWSSTTGAVTFANSKSATPIGDVDTILTTAAISAHQSEYIYLMIYATTGNNKVIKAAISAPVRAGYQGVVQIQENGALQTAEPKTGENVKYTVYIMDGATAITTKWDGTAQGYVAVDGSGDPIYLDPTKTYTVKTSAYEGDTTTTALTGESIKGDDLAKNSHIATAEYFTVTAVATTAEHYVDAVGETFDTDNMPKAKLSVGGADVDGKTVLKGQNVAAKFDEETAGSGVAWTQDYTLTWQEKKENAADGSSLDDTTLKDTATSAVTGRTWEKIQTKTYIGGRLDQNVYTITGTIVGSGTVASVVMTDGNSNENTTVAGGNINKDNSNKIADLTTEGGNNNGTVGDAGDKITLKVVKGTYALTANAGENTTVLGIKWADDTREVGTTVTGKNVAADRTFVVYLDAATAKLQVADTHTNFESKTSDASSTNANFQDADHTHQVYFSTMTADTVLTVNLKNKGNTALTLDTPTIWKVNAGKALTDVSSYWSKWTDAANPVTKIDTVTGGVYSETDVIAIANLLTDDNKTLSGATTNASGVPQDDGGDVDAATVTIDKKVDVADSGIYILRYTTGDGGPVAYYVLNLVVDPLPIKSVTTDTLSEAPGAGDKVRMEGYSATPASDTSFAHVFVNDGGTADVAASTVLDPALTDGTDVKYQWVKATTNLTAAQAKGHLSVGTSGVSGDATVTVLSGNGADSKEYTLQAADEDAYLYLVAYAPKVDPVVNTTDFAVSAPVKTKESVKIFVTLNGRIQPTGTNASDPGYTIKLLPPDGDPDTDLIDTTWNTSAVANNNDTKYYTAAIDTAKTYKIYAVSYKGGTALVDTGLTLGKQAPGDSVVKEETVPYWNVTFNENVPVVNAKGDGLESYLPGGDANSTNALQKAMSVAVSDAKGGTATYNDGVKLPSGTTPVLEGMNVKVAVDGTQPNGNGDDAKTWTDYSDFHTMSIEGWKTTDNKDKGIGYAANIASGNIEVKDSAKEFKAQLDQILFTARFLVVDVSEPDQKTTTKLASATLICAQDGVTGWSNITVTSFESGDGSTGSIVKFENVPAGKFAITAHEDPLASTIVSGYTWGTGKDDPTSDDPAAIVTITTDATKNNDASEATGNTIQIQEATNLVRWEDNFDTATGAANMADGKAVTKPSNGFKKVDDGTTDLALHEGYNATDDVLTYTARAYNSGTLPLENFTITASTLAVPELTYDLGSATLHAADGSEITDRTGNVLSGILLNPGEYVEFTITIVEGKDAQRDRYQTTVFAADCTGGLPDARRKYTPAYQVKANVTAEGDTAAVFYGAKDFDGAKPKVKTKDGFTGQKFAYNILTEAELTVYLDGAARPDNVYTKDGDTTGDTAVNVQPGWLKLDGTTGEFSVEAAATGVHVRKDGDGKDVTNELVVYVKITSEDDPRLELIVPVTIDVKTTPLKVITANIAATDQQDKDGDDYRTLYNGATTDTYPGQGEDIAHGEKVLLEYFNYIQVESQKNSTDVVDSNGHGAYAAGANRWNSADGADNTGYGKVDVGHWEVLPTSFDGTGKAEYDPNGGATNRNKYTFTYRYDGTGDIDKYDYADAEIVLAIPVLVPALSLKFADTVKNYDDVVDTLNRGDTYTNILTDAADPTKEAPKALDYHLNAQRKGETLVYLDEEPDYTVKLQRLGVIYGLELKTEDVDGFEIKGGLPTNPSDEDFDNGVLTLEVNMTERGTAGSKLWVGEHKITIKATGYRTAEMTGEPVEATYELSVTVKPKSIPKAHVTELTNPAPDQQPDKTVKVTGEDPTDPTKDVELDTWTDKHGNHPIKPPVVTVTPDEKFKDGEDYTVTVTLTPDPNYTFEDKTPEDEEPNYTAGDEGPDDDYTVTVTPDPAEDKQNKEVKFEKTTELPKRSQLRYSDTRTQAGTAKSDTATGTASTNYVRNITVVRGETLGKYQIDLGAYDNTVTGVKVKMDSGDILGLVNAKLTPTITFPETVGALDDVNATPAGAKHSYELDLSDVYTVDVDAKTYTLKFTATGKDPYETDVSATYTLNITVTKAPTPELQFHDTKRDGTDTKDVTIPADGAYAKEYTRTVTVERGKTLGKYVIDLRAITNVVNDVTVSATTQALPDGTDWDVTFPDTVGTMAAGAKKEYVELDLSGVDTAKLMGSNYTLLVLNAAGTDLNGEDVAASYTLVLKVTDAPTPELRFHDTKLAGTATTDVTIPADGAAAKEYTRTVTVERGKTLGKYVIDLNAITNVVNDVTVSATTQALPDGTDWDVTFPDKMGTMAAGAKKEYVELDLSGVDTGKLTRADYKDGRAVLVLDAAGTDLNGRPVTAKYTLVLKVTDAPAPALKFDDVKTGGNTSDAPASGPEENLKRSINARTGTQLGKYTIYLGSYEGISEQVKITSKLTNMVYNVKPDCDTLPLLVLQERGGLEDKTNVQVFTLDLSGLDTKNVGTHTLTLTATGVDINGDPVEATYTLTINLSAGGGGGGGGAPACPSQVSYQLGLYGTTKDPVMELVTGKNVKAVPNVNAIVGYKFLGWSLAKPIGDADKDAARTLVDPKQVTIEGDTVFYAVYQPLYNHGRPFHKHYVIGYPNGNFGPTDNINRASVATIIARAVLPNFVEGADYGNPGNYSDVSGHWASSAIAYCTRYGVFKGYEDGTFRPDQPISRQELVLTLARLSGEQTGTAPFSDMNQAGDWAKGGIYTAYVKGWVNGYTDGTFRPTNPIARDETVKIFNAYLYRGVNAEGLADLTEYVHSGVASNNTENGTTEYMTWPDVPKDQWAYYEIIEAANDHEYVPDATKKAGYTLPEVWTKCWIDEKWRYHDDPNDGGPAAVTMALLRKYGVIA